MSLPQARYRPSLIALHWLTFVLVIAVYATMELRGMFPRGSGPRELMKTAHYFLGLSVLLLTVLRLFVRLSSPAPPIQPQPPAWQNVLAKLMALALYGLMLSMPVLGYLLLNADGHAPTIAGISLPALIGPQETLAETLEHWHESLASVGYWLIGLHAVAAIYHHHVRHDNTLLRMSLKP